MRLTLATDPAAPPIPAGAPLPSLLVLDKNRCRVAPRFPLLSLAFPAPGQPPVSAAQPSLVAPSCGISTPKELDLNDPFGSWSYPMLTLLGSKVGADFTGYLSADSIRPGPADPLSAVNSSSAACGPGYAPVWFLSWFPQSSDSVPWRVTLLQRSFPFFGITGVNDLSVGLTPLQSFDVSKREGMRLPNPLAAQRYANPSGDIQSLCASFGIYELTAIQAVAPHRPGRFFLASPSGCALTANTAPPALTGAASESGVLGYFVVGSRNNATETPYPNCTRVLDTQSARAGWDGCEESGGARLYSLFYGAGVFHASDASWRAEYLGSNPAAPSEPIVTLLGGRNYLRNRNTLEKWCVKPGLLRVHAYDNNAVSAANASKGWDGGNLIFTDPSGCILGEVNVDMTDANAAADIHHEWLVRSLCCVRSGARGLCWAPAAAAASCVLLMRERRNQDFACYSHSSHVCPEPQLPQQDMIVYPDGACPRTNPRLTGVVNISLLAAVGPGAPPPPPPPPPAAGGNNNASTPVVSDGGNCLFSIKALETCATQPKGLAGRNTLLGISDALGSTCQAICAAEPCDDASLYVAGPVPPTYGCCEQARVCCACPARRQLRQATCAPLSFLVVASPPHNCVSVCRRRRRRETSSPSRSASGATTLEGRTTPSSRTPRATQMSQTRGISSSTTASSAACSSQPRATPSAPARGASSRSSATAPPPRLPPPRSALTLASSPVPLFTTPISICGTSTPRRKSTLSASPLGFSRARSPPRCFRCTST